MKVFNVSYKRNEVYQAILIKAESAEHAQQFFKAYKPDAEIYGAAEVTDISEDMRKGKPLITALKFMPVSEKLPETDGRQTRVYMQCSDGTITKGMFYMNGGKAIFAAYGSEVENVTAWAYYER